MTRNFAAYEIYIRAARKEYTFCMLEFDIDRRDDRRIAVLALASNGTAPGKFDLDLLHRELGHLLVDHDQSR